MADLHNLLDKVNDALDDNEEEELESEEQPTQEVEDWNHCEELELPAALEEFEQKKLLHNDNEEEDVLEEEEEDASETHCYVKLKRLWQQELACPELLPLDEETIQEVSEELEQREQAVAELAEQAGDMEALLGSVLKVDTDRAKFMLSDLLRTRLWKIQEHPLHMRDLVDRMSESEVEFLRGYGQLLESHLRRTVLDHVSKDAFKNLDEQAMIDRPNLEQYVFVKVKETSEINSGTEEEPSVQQHPAGTTLITRYSVVRDLFGQGKVELVL